LEHDLEKVDYRFSEKIMLKHKGRGMTFEESHPALVFRRPAMVPKSVLTAALVGVTLLAVNGRSVAQGDNSGQYKPGDFFSLDLSKAVLSPKRLGPETQFAPVPIEADSGKSATQASVVPDATPRTAPHVTVRKTRVAEAPSGRGSRERAPSERAHNEKRRSERPRGEARTRLARRHSNPLDAEAFDRSIQVWPCRSGGICNWKRR
jgi:hypothetical protein